MSLAHCHLNTISPSLNVTGDILFSYKKLDRIKGDLKIYEASTNIKLIEPIQKGLEQVIKVYNENVHAIKDGNSKVKPFEYPTFEQWLKLQPSYPTRSREQLAQEYEEDRDRAHNKSREKLEVNYNLAQLADPQIRLKKKIEKLIQRVSTANIPTDQLSKLQGLELSEIDSLRFHTMLREPKADWECYLKPLSEVESNTTTPTTDTSEQPAPSPVSPSVEVDQSVQSAPRTHSTTIHCPLADNEILGICQDSEWEKKPIPFTSSDHQNWQVELPLDKEFKYVIIKDGKVDKWESRAGNRSLRPDSSIPSAFDKAPRF